MKLKFYLVIFIVNISLLADNVILGRAIFKRIWVKAPSSTTAADGLGPLYNARSCAVCHKTGRKGTIKKGQFPRILFRLNSDKIYGNQFQPLSIAGLLSEGQIKTSYINIKKILHDEIVYLRQPIYKTVKLNYGALANPKLLSARAAPSLRGAYLLEYISDKAIKNNVIDQNTSQYGISGRIHWVKDLATGKQAIGRFGYKATQPTLRQQAASALFNDMGLSSPLFPKGEGECTSFQKDCLKMPNGNSAHYENLEVHSVLESLILNYLHSLDPDTPKSIKKVKKDTKQQNKRKIIQEKLQLGQKLFNNLNCIQCHKAIYKTSVGVIKPYTDLLLHNMGNALDDGVREGNASGSEWKTPALWGIAKRLRGQKPYFLHDGRARNIQEAILWHGGEALQSRLAYEKLSKQDRQALIRFIESL